VNKSNPEGRSPFHRYEQALQDREGKREVMEKFGRKVVRSYLPDQHRDFYSQLPYIVVGSVDNEGDTWATILAGSPGFVRSPSPTTLNIDLHIARGDPLRESIHNVGASVGLLGVDLESRRRNRVNVRIAGVQDNVVHLTVDQSFGNCPQYIQSRALNYSRAAHVSSEYGAVSEFTALGDDAGALITHADTFFVSSFIVENDDPTVEGVDVSHRGGMPGFVKVEGNTLTIPDFPGNYHFNTLGNFLANPKAGLVFPDFETGDLLSLTGSTEILWEDHPEVKFFRGAQRAWRFTVKKGKWLRKALPFTARFDQFSLNSEMTGTWKEAEERQTAEQLKANWQPMELVRVEQESSVISSFYFKHKKNKALLPFEAGQYLTIKANTGQSEKSIIRTYTVSSAPNEDYYRVSIKREPKGTASRFMHDKLRVGDVIDAKYPSGNFYIDAEQKRPAVLIAGGVGVTPMISMAQHVLKEGVRTRHARDVYIFHAAKDREQRAFYKEFKQIEEAMGGKVRYYSFLSQPKPNDRPGDDYNGLGRINADVFREVLPLDEYDFYVCGPSQFMQSIYDELSSLGVRDGRIFSEAFGPASIARKKGDCAETGESVDDHEESEEAVIRFTQSQFEQRWNKGDDVLLDVAESHGLTPSSSCRNGICGACAVPIKSGEVSYRTKPSAPIPDGHALICCAVPAKGTASLELDI